MRLVRSFTAFTFLVCFSLFLVKDSAFSYGLEEKKPFKNSGPIAIRNQMPLYLFYLQMVPDKADVTERNKFKINADYTVSNVTVSAFTPISSLYKVDIDLEVSRITLDFRYGLWDNLEVGLEVPYISFSSGYLDNFIEGIEDGIGARTPRSRERQGSYEFDYSFRYNGQYLIQQKRSTDGIGDIVFNAKYQVLKERSWFLPNVSVRTSLKLPSAKKEDLLGSGEVDYGIGLLMDKSFFDRFFIYIGANAVIIEKPSMLSVLGIDEEIYSGLLAIECFLTKRLSFVAQVTGNTTPYPYSDTNPLDNEGYELGLGVNYTWKEKTNISWNFAIVENITAASSPDVSLHTGFGCKF
ncbi:DUF3187 family protein [Candidatus Omnitrophota bacterium]